MWFLVGGRRLEGVVGEIYLTVLGSACLPCDGGSEFFISQPPPYHECSVGDWLGEMHSLQQAVE